MESPMSDCNERLAKTQPLPLVVGPTVTARIHRIENDDIRFRSLLAVDGRCRSRVKVILRQETGDLFRLRSEWRDEQSFGQAESRVSEQPGQHLLRGNSNPASIARPRLCPNGRPPAQPDDWQEGKLPQSPLAIKALPRR